MAERLPSVTRSEIIIESSYQREDDPRPGCGAPPGRSAQGSRYRRSIGGPALPHRHTATGNKLRRLMFRKSKAISAGAAQLTGEEGTPANEEGLNGHEAVGRASQRNRLATYDDLASPFLFSLLPLSPLFPRPRIPTPSVCLSSSLFLGSFPPPRRLY